MVTEEEGIVAAAAERMSLMVDKYWSLTDNCELYRLAICESIDFDMIC